MNKTYSFQANEGFQAVILDLIGKKTIQPKDFNYLVGGLLLEAHTKTEGSPVLFKRDATFVCTGPFFR